jgi:hypothetical protein
MGLLVMPRPPRLEAGSTIGSTTWAAANSSYVEREKLHIDDRYRCRGWAEAFPQRRQVWQSSGIEFQVDDLRELGLAGLILRTRPVKATLRI